MTRNQRPPLTKVLLNLLATTGQTAVDFSTMLYDLKYHRGTYLRGGHTLVKEYQRLSKETAAKRALTQLRQARYITAQKIGKRLLVTLTAKGRAATLVTQLKRAPRRPDTLSTVVVFDIPESQNIARRQFRWLLRQGGFAKLQQSVWVSRADVYKLVAQFVAQAKLKPWVNVFHAEHFLHLPHGK